VWTTSPAVIIILLQNNPKDKSWNAATKMMSNVDKFMETLKGFKQKIDDGEVPKKSVDACRPYLELEHFNRDAIYNKSRAAAGLCEFAINIIKYFRRHHDDRAEAPGARGGERAARRGEHQARGCAGEGCEPERARRRPRAPV
jgi:hypothetical protein